MRTLVDDGYLPVSCSDVATVDGNKRAVADGSEVTIETAAHRQLVQIMYVVLTRASYHVDRRQCTRYIFDCNQPMQISMVVLHEASIRW